jgi:hypothetical protein
MTAPRLGSGERFKKLSSTLAARGAKNPDALAAYIGRKKWGGRKMGQLSAHGRSSSHANPLTGLLFAGAVKMQCPKCGYKSDDADFRVSGGTAGTSDPGGQGVLRTPANTGLQSSAGFSPSSAGVNVRSGPGGAGLSNTHPGLEFAGSRRMPVTTGTDIVVSRGTDGRAIIRHRRGGDKIGEIWRTESGQWMSSLEGGGDLAGRTHQRAAVQDLIGNWNKTAASLQRAAGPLQPPAQQTDLMRQYGIPAISALASPMGGSSDGPRATTSGGSDGDGDDDTAGLGSRGKAVYKKLRGRGWPHPRAHAFASRAENMAAK